METFDSLFQKPSIPLGRLSFFAGIVIISILSLLITKIFAVIESRIGLTVFSVIKVCLIMILCYRRILDFKSKKTAKILVIILAILVLFLSLFTLTLLNIPDNGIQSFGFLLHTFVLLMTLIYPLILISLCLIPRKSPLPNNL